MQGFVIVDCDLLAPLPANHFPTTGFGAPVTLEQRIYCFRKEIDGSTKGMRNANGFLVHGLAYNDVIARWQEYNRRLRADSQQGLIPKALPGTPTSFPLLTLPVSNLHHANAQDGNGMQIHSPSNSIEAMYKRLLDETSARDALGKELIWTRRQLKNALEQTGEPEKILNYLGAGKEHAFSQFEGEQNSFRVMTSKGSPLHAEKPTSKNRTFSKSDGRLNDTIGGECIHNSCQQQGVFWRRRRSRNGRGTASSRIDKRWKA